MRTQDTSRHEVTFQCYSNYAISEGKSWMQFLRNFHIWCISTLSANVHAVQILISDEQPVYGSLLSVLHPCTWVIVLLVRLVLAFRIADLGLEILLVFINKVLDTIPVPM